VAHIDKYLLHYAEPEAGGLSGNFRNYRYSLVIPAHAEPANRLERVWKQLPNPEQLLIIIVANAAHHDPDTIAMVHAITSARAATPVGQQAKLLTAPGSPDILLVDRYADGHQVPAKQGVGLARKIGCDVALALHQAGIIKSQWLRTTDADVILPPDYLQSFSGDEVARLYPFEHCAVPGAAPSELLGLQLYEIYLLYTVLGLRSAGSPYAYPTIGSIIACRADAYAAVRGFPRRATGEDFYLLNKLRKTGAVSLVIGKSIEISGRVSERVPVGTGQAVRRIAASPNPLLDYTFEHPDCYAGLGALLQYLDELAARQPDTMAHPDSLIQSIAVSTGLAAHYERERKRGISAGVMRKSLHDWFDGLRTRQFIRRLSDETGRIPLSALAASDLLSLSDPSPAAVLLHLRRCTFNSPDLDQ
jgi:hypothetical protein